MLQEPEAVTEDRLFDVVDAHSGEVYLEDAFLAQAHIWAAQNDFSIVNYPSTIIISNGGPAPHEIYVDYKFETEDKYDWLCCDCGNPACT